MFTGLVDRRRGGATAILEAGQSGWRRVSYDELLRAAALRREGLARTLRPGQLVFLRGNNSSAWLASFLAATDAGAVVVPLPVSTPEPKVRALAERLGVTAMLDAAHDFAPTRLPQPADAPPPPEGTAVVLLSSGTTGEPKGICLGVDGLAWGIRAEAPANRFVGRPRLVTGPLSHMNGLTNSLRTLAGGGTVVYPADLSGRGVEDALVHGRVEEVLAVPALFAKLLTEGRAGVTFPLVRHVSLGSAAPSEELAGLIAAAFPEAVVTNRYGTTEAGFIVFQFDSDAPLTSLGRPDPRVEVRLRDAADVEGGREGVLQVRSPLRALGYLGTSAPFPLEPDGFVDTGDRFRVGPDGRWAWLGRADDMVDCGGQLISLEEVAQAVRSHPGVLNAQAVAVPSATKANKPVVFVVPRGDAAPGEEELRAWASQQLDPVALPRQVWLLDALPVGAAGKVDLAALRQRALAEARPEVRL